MRHFTLTISIIAAMIATPAASQQADTDPVERIAIADLDLGSAEGRRLLTRRVGRATELACGSYAGVRENAEIDGIDQCRRRARAEVERQVAAIVKHHGTRSASR